LKRGGDTNCEVHMETITALPEQMYDYVHGQYGTVGLIVAGVILVVLIVCVFIWFDRRK
jgi:hypothetical protein